MNVIAVKNNKGGVGKSTIAAHIAVGIAARGRRVGLIDTDTQGHASFMLNAEERDGLYDVLIGGRPISEAVVPVEIPDLLEAGHLWLLPGAMRTYKIAHELGDERAFAFVELCDDMAKQFALDVIVVDTAPTMSQLDGAIMLAVDEFLYVTECERLAFDGVVKAIAQMEQSAKSRRRWMNRDSRILGIIPNKMRAGTSLHRHNIKMLSDHYGPLVWPPIRQATVWPEAANFGQLIYQYAPADGTAAEAWAITDRVIAEMEARHG